METDLILLLASTTVKSIVLIGIGTFLIKKWNKQDQKYMTDFPVLMAMLFFIFGIAKIFDIYLYTRFSDTPNLAELNTPNALLIAKVRFLLSPVLCVVPIMVLMLIIWFGEKKKLQVLIGSLWATISIVSVLVAQNYPQLLSTISLVAFPPIIFSIITYGILYRQKKIPEINSKYLAIGWASYLVTQLIRPIWMTLGSGEFGLSWLGELIELMTMVIVGLGYMKSASYNNVSESSGNTELINKQNHKSSNENLKNTEKGKQQLEVLEITTPV
jgi:hypothetical protein